MSIKQATRLVIDSAEFARGGEVFVTKMPSIRIYDLAEVMIEEWHLVTVMITEYKIDLIGSKPGEKLYEELLSMEETRRTVELTKYFSVLPAFRGIYDNISYGYDDVISTEVDNPYNSANEEPLSKAELKDFLYRHGLLEDSGKERVHPDSRYFPVKREGM